MPQAPRWGATPQDWRLFAETLGLTADLLPVVSNPQAIISPLSKMATLGKTPSLYNRNGQVTSIKGWTQKRATEHEVAGWRLNADYGICVQTRHVRAFDIDVEDPVLAQAIHAHIENELDETLPCRTRGASGKRLLVVQVEGEFAKRVMTVAGGMKVEFLADGQQFIAAGTHTSGNRYTWQWPFEAVPEVPTINVATLEGVWASLVSTFAIEAPTQAGAARRRGANLQVMDEVVDKLDVIGEGADGQLYITCPFEADHTSPSNTPDTCYFPAGSGGYEKGHFKCLHAHCTGRNDGDFLDALNLREGMFEGILKEGPKSDLTGESADSPEPLPPLRRKKSGEALATIDNVLRILARPDICHMQIGMDEFCGVIMRREGKGTWIPFKDSDYTTLRQTFDLMGFAPVGRELIRDCVEKHAEVHTFDSACQWLADVPAWDGVARVDRYLADYLGVADTPYTTAVSRYLWTALAGRIIEPGIKADMAVILSGPQGTGKSGMAKLLAPFPEAFAEISFGDPEDTLARRMRGKVAIEIGELKGLHNKEMEHVKAFISRQHEEWVPKYREFPKRYPRRCIFIGTTNQDEFLADSTGNRRWLPVVVSGQARLGTESERNRGVHAFESFKEHRLQFWAEARVLFASEGVCAVEAEKLADDAHDHHTLVDSWEDQVHDWLSRPEIDGEIPAARAALRSVDVLREALGMTTERITKGHEMRVASILKGLGFTRTVKRTGDKVSKVWVKETVH